MNHQLELPWGEGAEGSNNLIQDKPIQDKPIQDKSIQDKSIQDKTPTTGKSGPHPLDLDPMEPEPSSIFSMEETLAISAQPSDDAIFLASESVVQVGSGDASEALEPEDNLQRIINESNDPNAKERRIKQLELALEQCENYINELKAILADQAFLESQLADTEDYSHIQQQAIATLKGQLGEYSSQQSTIETLQQQRDTLSIQLEEQRLELAQLHDEQEQAIAFIDQLNEQIARLQTQLQFAQDSTVRETQQKIIAKQNLERLRSDLRKKDDLLTKLNLKLKSSEEKQVQLQNVINALRQANQSDSQKNLAIQDLSATLLKSQNKIAGLDHDLSHQLLIQTQLQQASQELEDQLAQALSRTDELEKQTAEMQEQILHQAQQGREYETAIQHWKDKTVQYERALEDIWPLLVSIHSKPQHLTQKQLLKISQWIKTYVQG